MLREARVFGQRTELRASATGVTGAAQQHDAQEPCRQEQRRGPARLVPMASRDGASERGWLPGQGSSRCPAGAAESPRPGRSGSSFAPPVNPPGDHAGNDLAVSPAKRSAVPENHFQSPRQRTVPLPVSRQWASTPVKRHGRRSPAFFWDWTSPAVERRRVAAMTAIASTWCGLPPAAAASPVQPVPHRSIRAGRRGDRGPVGQPAFASAARTSVARGCHPAAQPIPRPSLRGHARDPGMNGSGVWASARGAEGRSSSGEFNTSARHRARRTALRCDNARRDSVAPAQHPSQTEPANLHVYPPPGRAAGHSGSCSVLLQRL